MERYPEAPWLDMPISVEFESRRKCPRGEALARGLLYQQASSIESPTSVLLLHEWWGVDDFICDIAQSLSSRHGFRCLVVDVFRGVKFSDAKLAKKNMMTFDHEQASHDVRAAAEYLRRLQLAADSGTNDLATSTTVRKSIGCIGFGFGAQLALLSGCPVKLGGEPPLQAIAPVCGTAKGDNLKKICKYLTCPIQVLQHISHAIAYILQNPTPCHNKGHYAEFDVVKGVSSPEDYELQAAHLREAEIPLEMKIYAAKHAFFNPVYPNYNSRCTEQFFLNVTSFMERTL